MSSVLLDVLPEVQENILRYCTVDELRNLSRCNSLHHAAVVEKLWWKVAIPVASMLHHNFLETSCRHRKHLMHTRVLRFHVGMLLPQGSNTYARISEHYAAVLKSLRAGNMRELSLDEAFIDDKSLELTCRLLPNLQTLTLVGYTYYNRRLTPSALRNVARLKNLTCLNLHGTHMDDVTMTAICGKLPELEVLDLGGTCVTDMSVGELVVLKMLKKLVLSECRIGEQGLQSITTLSGLRHLDVGGCTAIPPHAFECLQRLSQLQSLNVSKCDVNERSLHNIGTLITLKELNMMGCSNLDVDGIAQLRNLSQLTFLDISRTKISDDGLKKLSSLRCLRELNVSSTNITDTGIEHAVEISSLETLRISGNNITDSCATSICKLKHLKELDLNYCRQISDVGIGNLVALASLESLRLECLNIHCTQVTVQGLKHLSKIKHLRRIGCSFNPGTIRTYLPHVELPNRCGSESDEMS